MKLSLLHRLYLKIDSQIPLFNKFYSQLLESEAIRNAPASIQESGDLSYNLLSQCDYQELTHFLKTCEAGNLLEFGCGLSPVSQLLKKQNKKDVSVLGLDFSDRVISHNKNQFPEHEFFQFHQHFDPPGEYDYLVLTDALYLGSRKDPFKEVLNRLLKNCRRKAILIQNHQQANISSLYPLGIPQKDSTESFRYHVLSWLEFLQSPEVELEKKKFKLLWDTITKEMNHHLAQLENQNEEHKLKRIITLYEN